MHGIAILGAFSTIFSWSERNDAPSEVMLLYRNALNGILLYTYLQNTVDQGLRVRLIDLILDECRSVVAAGVASRAGTPCGWLRELSR